MRLRFYSVLLAVTLGAIGLLGAGGPRFQVRPPAKTWRAVGAIQPRLSPDGATIVFAYQGAIWRIPREGGLMRRLTTGAAWDSDPAWSPDGARIAYLSAGEIVLMEVETGRRVSPSIRAAARGPIQFHPDGSRILTNARLKSGYALAWVPLDGAEVRPVFDPPVERTFALSPDGKEIAVVVHQDVPGEQSGHNGPEADVWIVTGDAAERRKLTRFPSRIFNLAWNGRSLLAVSDVGGAHNDLWEIPLDAPHQARKLTFGQADEDAPSVAGDWLVATDNREGATALVVRGLSSGDEKTLVVTGLDFGKPTGLLKLEFVDKSTGKPLAARVALQEENGKPAAPPGSLYRIHGDQMDVTIDGATEFPVPSGPYHLHAWHGPEYRPAHDQFDVVEGTLTKRRVELERWVDPASKGWHSGENHIHANYGYGHWYNTPEEMRRMIEAEDLNVANFVVANSDTDGVFDREFFRGRPDPGSGPRNILYWNEEFRATLWGHLTLINLKQLVEPVFTGFAATTNPWDAPTNADIADHTHLQGGHVNYTHPASNIADPYLSAYSAKSLPVDVALGKIDSLDINGNYDAAVPLWHRFLNCGFHLPASAGTDCFLNRIRSRLPGADRVYVKIEGDFSYDAWIKGLRAGRTFVSNGPILDFQPGETIRLDREAEIPVKVEATSEVPINRLEVVVNGDVRASQAVAAGQRTATLETKVRMERSGWIGVRVYAGRLQAHSSPIYVELGGRPAGSKADAAYFLAWIDRLGEQLAKRDRLPGEAAKKHVSDQLDQARAVYRAILARE